MENRYQKIVLLGHSGKFLKLVHSLFTDSKVTVIPWRNCDLYSLSLGERSVPDLLVICGYDYASGWYDFQRYIDVNVIQPCKVVTNLCNHSTHIVYIDTQHGRGSLALSRYQYAKNLLARRLSEKFPNCSILSIPTVVGDDEKADIRGGLFTKIIFNFFIRRGNLKTVSEMELKRIFKEALSSKKNFKLNTLQPKFLSCRRSLFIDRLLRFFSA